VEQRGLQNDATVHRDVKKNQRGSDKTVCTGSKRIHAREGVARSGRSDDEEAVVTGKNSRESM